MPLPENATNERENASAPSLSGLQSVIRRIQRGNPNSGKGQVTSNRAPFAPGGIPSGDVDSLLPDFAAAESDASTNSWAFRGPRGVRTGGELERVPVGLPPALGGPPRLFAYPKESSIPIVPPQFEEYLVTLGSSTVTGQILLDRQLAFPCRSIKVDNYTGVWLYIEALRMYIPPFCIATTWPVPAAPNKLSVRAETPQGLTTFGSPVAGQTALICCSEKEDMFVANPGILLKLPTVP
jgi:hypothetical protein